MERCRPTVEMLVAAIARSSIVAACAAPRFPTGFEAVDVAILEWIAAEGRRIGRGFALM